MWSPFFFRLKAGGICFFIVLLNFQVNARLPFPDTLWVPVIFYDYHADGRADFETCEDPNSTVGQKGMVLPWLDDERKPVPIPLTACPGNDIIIQDLAYTSYPCACYLYEWFRVSGRNGSDNTCIFQCDSLTDPDKPKWSWSGLVPYRSRTGEYTGPNYNADYAMANVIIYDSLPFLYVRNSDGMYDFIDDAFLPLDGRGFGNEPPGLEEPHNFGFTMELHTKFKYQKGLTFSFRGDDDVWAFIDDRLVMDLGGPHYYMDSFIDLDTIADLVAGKTYGFELYYAERHSTGSHIHITSNVISASPSEMHITVFPSDTIRAGDTALIIGTVIDENGKGMPIQSDSIGWTQHQSNVRGGDRIIVPRNDTTKFTATVAYRRIGIIGTYRSGSIAVVDTAWIYIRPADPSQVDINLQSAAALTREEVISRTDTFSVCPRQTITLGMGRNSAYAYAVLRDRFGNYCYLADTSVWVSQNTAAATVAYVANGAFEGVIGRQAGVLNGSATVIVSRGALTPDTADVVLVADTLVALRLVDTAHADVALDTVYLAVDSSITVQVQGIWSNNPGVWVDVTGTWTLQPAGAVAFSIPVPAAQAGRWTITPVGAGTTQLTVNSLNASTSVPIIVKRITKLRLVDVNVPDLMISVIRLSTDDTLTVKLQGTWSDAPDTWIDLTGTWSLNPSEAITFSIPLPDGEAGQWTIAPSTEGVTKLTVTSHGESVTVPISVTLADITGPYAVKAIFTTGPLGESYDILKVIFSEPVNCDSLKKSNADPASSFKVIGPGDSVKTDAFDGAHYSDEGACPVRFVTEIIIITKVSIGRFVPNVDSLLLFGSAVDTAGNRPDTTRRGPIVYGPGTGISIVPYQHDNPSVLPMVVPPEIIDRFALDRNGTEGKVIFIQTRRPLVPFDTLPNGDVTFGKTVVYDAVGNVVAADLPIRRAPSSDRLYTVFWDCRNRSKRKVASGVYLFKASVVYDNDSKQSAVDRVKFTVKWRR